MPLRLSARVPSKGPRTRRIRKDGAEVARDASGQDLTTAGTDTRPEEKPANRPHPTGTCDAA